MRKVDEDVATFVEPGADTAGTTIDARFLSIDGTHMAMVMPDDGWSALLSALRSASTATPAYATWYAGLKHGLGFKTPEELLGPEQPTVQS